MKHAIRAAEFVQDHERMRWHDQALWFVRQKRDAAAREVPEWEQLRLLAAQIKQHTLSRLDEYLVQFEAQAVARGAHVHWAVTPDDHNRIVLDILRREQARSVVKSKSMLTEECHLNQHLEANGIQVTDTDLGEWIVQLRDEPPSHIVLPAIHVKKESVSELFHARLGTEAGNADPSYLTEAARQRLRKHFHEADAGITGVNFAIAETGGIVVCTNEGNADLGTALPPLHIACMGLEKIIPRWTDLGVFTRLLARSATGQPITAYTSHFHGPQPNGALHIIILDNGRTSLLADRRHAAALRCIRCGACLNTCPVYRRSGGHSYEATVAGPIGSILQPARDPQRYASLPFACSLCGSCTDVCPVQINLHQQLLAMRRKLWDIRLTATRKRWMTTMAAFVMSRPRLFYPVARASRRFMAWLLRVAPIARRFPWTRQRDWPRNPPTNFRTAAQDDISERESRP